LSIGRVCLFSPTVIFLCMFRRTLANRVKFPALHCRRELRGSFQMFCTLYVFSLKINLFYKTHLQTFNVISVVLYHSGPTCGQVLYSYCCQDAFVVDASDCSGSVLLKRFPRSGFFNFENKSESGGLMSGLYGE
jgi:hypothetical protein